MSLEDLQEKLNCRYCGNPRIVTQVSKPKKDQVKLYMSCPKHPSEVVYKMPLNLFEQASSLIRDHVFLCRKCGQHVDIVGQRSGSRMTTLQIRCPTHDIGERRINSSLFDMTMSGAPTAETPVAEAKETPGVKAKFCPSCGTPVPAPDAQFCHNCGASLY